jgi:predicted metal-dependent phosphoesterase TrpH
MCYVETAMKYIDLHAHTTASDGSFAPSEVVGMAGRAGLLAVGITDHDTTDGVGEALAAGERLDLEVVPGVELSVDHPRLGSLHILGYWIQPDHPDLAGRLEEIRGGRDSRNQKILDRLASLGCPLDLEEVRQIAGGEVVGRPHLARAMIEHGYVQTTQEAFDRYLARGRPAYLERERMGPEEAIDRIRRAGGVAVWAHPGLIGLEEPDLEREIVELAQAGLCGVEAHYPEHSPGTTELLLSLCDRYGLAPTGGTDFHGEVKPQIQLGSLPVPAALLEGLRAKRP